MFLRTAYQQDLKWFLELQDILDEMFWWNHLPPKLPHSNAETQRTSIQALNKWKYIHSFTLTGLLFISGTFPVHFEDKKKIIRILNQFQLFCVLF